MAVIGESLGTRDARAARWRERLSALDFDPSVNLIDWPECLGQPELALRLRFGLLKRRLDVVQSAALTDWQALAPGLLAEDERICFWGSAETVAAVRAWFDGEQELSAAALDEIKLGTITYVREREPAEILIADHLASTTSAVPSLAVGIITINAIYSAGAVAVRTELRNRRPGGRAPSGLAGHMLSVRELLTSYWGVVPWYIGWGEQEILDYCELPARPELTRQLINETPDLFIADAGERDYVAALVSLNLGEEYHGVDSHVLAGPLAPTSTSWELHAPSPLLMPWQRLVLRPSEDGEHSDLAAALQAAAAMPRAVVVTAEIPIEDSSFLEAQCELSEAGFVLSALAPPLPGETGRVGFVGLWSQVSSGLPISAPYYLDSKLLNDRERGVVEHVARISKRWDGREETRAA
jgi:hypothetical protein